MYNEIKNIIEMEKYYTNIKLNVICECGNKKNILLIKMVILYALNVV